MVQDNRDNAIQPIAGKKNSKLQKKLQTALDRSAPIVYIGLQIALGANRSVLVWCRSLFPAHAGMARKMLQRKRRQVFVSRSCGDGPKNASVQAQASLCFPLMRGWPEKCFSASAGRSLFPAHAGMARKMLQRKRRQVFVSRSCGDGPKNASVQAQAGLCFPLMRGWPEKCFSASVGRSLFPAHAGMARKMLQCKRRQVFVSRSCGDGPKNASAAAGAGSTDTRSLETIRERAGEKNSQEGAKRCWSPTSSRLPVHWTGEPCVQSPSPL